MPILRSVRHFARRCLPVAVAVLTPLALAPTARPQGLNTIAVELETLPSSYSTLATALRAAGLNTALAGPGPFTVFAPSDVAFGQLPPGTVETLLQPANRDQLTRILTYHVVPGRITSFDLRPGQSATLTTLAGLPLRVQVGADGSIRVNGANVNLADIPVANGVIHGIDGVLLP
ncbi:fasciclin [Synechococcus sp. 65AY6Li]|uniref:fasciclin domain-containing protein n=1 Tax=unclassified Synechococcus TaxID=2626047 RepID=UPI0000693FC7|nr:MULTISPECIES: fasciclin domain-containing protein [unclassified Synechococcus]ABC98520.1 fasciclin domain protein [Synechococcus sp. JA-3-3Ab]PIK91348.1 fasciclin [Synechococcus sp. 65AY6Li]PIK97315.1 fasciclin [Synechococcus sp. 63AY4M1]